MIIKRNGYFAIVLHEEENNLYAVTPKFNKVFKRAGANSAAYESYLEFVKKTEKKWGFIRIKAEDDYSVVDYETETMNEAVRKVISLSSNIIESAIAGQKSKKNPLDKYIMDEFFSDKKKIAALINTKKEAKETIENLNVLASSITDISAKIEGLAGALDTQAEFMNAEGVAEANTKLSAVLKVFSDNEVAEQIIAIAESLNHKDKDSFDAEAFLAL